MKTLYLASAIGTLLLLGCSGTDGSADNSQQAGKSGTAGAKPMGGGLAGSAGVPGASGQGGASTGGVSAGGAGGVSAGGAGGVSAGGVSAGGVSAGGVSAGGSPAAAGIPNIPGFPTGGGDSIGFAGFFNFGGTGSIRLPSNFAGAAGHAGTGFWISN